MKRIPGVLVLLFVASSAHAQPCGTVPAGLVHLWSGDGTAAESIGGNSGNVTSGVSYAPGVCGDSFVFDGTGAVVVPDSPALTLASSFTIAAWVRIDALTGPASRFPSEAPLLTHTTYGTGAGWSLHLTSNVLSFDWQGSEGYSVWVWLDELPLQTWMHVAVTRDADTLVLYLNGRPAAMIFEPRPIPDASGTLQIGATPSDLTYQRGYLNGAMDEVQIFTRALAAAEVQAIYDGAPDGVAWTFQPSRIFYRDALLMRGAVCQTGPQPCTASTQVILPGATSGTVRLRAFDSAGAPLGDWTAPAVAGQASFTDIVVAPANMPPQTGTLTAEYVAAPGLTVSLDPRGLSITPILEATIPIGNARGRPAIDEVTNRGYVPTCNYLIDNIPTGTVAVFDATTNTPLEPIVLPDAQCAFSVAVDSARRRLYVGDIWYVWVWDLDQHVVADAIPLFENGEWMWGGHVQVNPATGVVYVARGEALTTIDPSLSASDKVRSARYHGGPSCPNENPTIPAINRSTNLIYAGGTIFDGATGGTPLPFTYDFCRQQTDTEVGVNSRTNAVYSGVLIGNDDPPRDIEAEALQIREGDRSVAEFDAVQAQVPLSPSFNGRRLQWWGASLQPNQATNRVYASFGALWEYESHWISEDPINPPFGGPRVPSAVPVLVFDGTTGERVSEWWHQKPCDLATGKEDEVLGLAVNPVNGRIYLTSCGDIAVYHDPVVRQETTAAGSGVNVSVPEVSITFSGVTAPGETAVESIAAASLDVQLPGQFSLTGALAYEISTTASVTPPIVLCFDASSISDEATFNGLAVLHAEDGAWVDRTVSRDFSTGTVCASAPSLSPFAVARRKPYLMTPLYATTKAFRVGSTVPVKIQVFDATGANVSSEDLAVHAMELVRRSPEAAAILNDSGNANPDANFRYDASLAGYVYNLNTRGLASGTYDLRVRIGADGRLYTTPLQLR